MHTVNDKHAECDVSLLQPNHISLPSPDAKATANCLLLACHTASVLVQPSCLPLQLLTMLTAMAPLNMTCSSSDPSNAWQLLQRSLLLFRTPASFRFLLHKTSLPVPRSAAAEAAQAATARLVQLPQSFFRLLSRLAAVPAGRKALVGGTSAALLRRILERLALTFEDDVRADAVAKAEASAAAAADALQASV